MSPGNKMRKLLAQRTSLYEFKFLSIPAPIQVDCAEYSLSGDSPQDSIELSILKQSVPDWGTSKRGEVRRHRVTMLAKFLDLNHLSWQRQSFALSNGGRWKVRMGYRLVPSCNHAIFARMPKFARISKICEKLENSRNLNSSVEAGRKGSN